MCAFRGKKDELTRPDGSPGDDVDVLGAIDPESDSASAVPDESQAGVSKYDRVVEVIEQLRGRVECPVILLGAGKAREASPRIAVNLAITLTQRKLRVLLVEADAASTDLAVIFDAGEGPGFFEWRRGDAWVSRATQVTQLPGLAFMVAGVATAEQSSGQPDVRKEQHRWGNLSNDFDVVLLYSPAAVEAMLGQGEQAAAACLADLADGVICVLGERSDVVGKVGEITAALSGHKAGYLGAILIRVNSGGSEKGRAGINGTVAAKSSGRGSRLKGNVFAAVLMLVTLITLITTVVTVIVGVVLVWPELRG